MKLPHITPEILARFREESILDCRDTPRWNPVVLELFDVLLGFTPHTLNEMAMCCRLGAAQSRQFAQAASSLVVKEQHERSAEFRDELARRLQEMATPDRPGR